MDEIKRSLFSNLLLVITVFLLTALAFFLGKTTANTEQLRAITGLAINELGREQVIPEFSTYTKAVCYNTTSKKQVCHDVLYAKCNGKEFPLPVNLTKPAFMPTVVLPNKSANSKIVNNRNNTPIKK